MNQIALSEHGGSENGTPFRTEDLEALLAVVDHGGLGAAARALGVPKSTVSRRLERLEVTIGVQLLARSRQSVRPTDEGARMVERAREALRDVAAMVAAARGVHDAPRGRLRVSAPSDLAAYSEVWLSFMEAYPLVELRLEFTNRYVDVVREGFNLAVRGGRGEEEALITRRLGAYALRAVAAQVETVASQQTPYAAQDSAPKSGLTLISPRGWRLEGLEPGWLPQLIKALS